MPQPVLETARLRLRPFTDGDAGRVRLLAGDEAVARGSILIPHPYPPGLAERWIATHASQWQQGHGVYYAITQQSYGILIGSISLHLEERRQASGAICHTGAICYTGTMGYWLGQPYWGAGLMTEAAQALLAFAFLELGVDRIEACHGADNPASGRVMEKCGLLFEKERQDARYRQPLREYAADWAQIKNSIKSDRYKIIN